MERVTSDAESTNARHRLARRGRYGTMKSLALAILERVGSMAVYDTHKAVKVLTDAGVPEEHAEAMVAVVGNLPGNLVTETVLDAKLQALELRMTLRLGGLVVAGVVFLAALITVFQFLPL